jgi:phenazine biosynthesis protein phzE
LLAVCLGHQVLAGELGLAVTRLGRPAQGVRRRISLGGRAESVGFYHSYAAVAGTGEVSSPLVDGPVRVLREPGSTTVHGLAAARLRSVQFHVESVLTEHGAAILAEMLISVLGGAQFPAPGTPRQSESVIE